MLNNLHMSNNYFWYYRSNSEVVSPLKPEIESETLNKSSSMIGKYMNISTTAYAKSKLIMRPSVILSIIIS